MRGTHQRGTFLLISVRVAHGNAMSTNWTIDSGILMPHSDSNTGNSRDSLHRHTYANNLVAPYEHLAQEFLICMPAILLPGLLCGAALAECLFSSS